MDVMTIFLAFQMILRGKLDICGRDDLFFELRLILRKIGSVSLFLVIFYFSRKLPSFFLFYCR